MVGVSQLVVCSLLVRCASSSMCAVKLAVGPVVQLAAVSVPVTVPDLIESWFPHCTQQLFHPLVLL